MPAPQRDFQLDFVSLLGRGGFGSVYLARLHGRNDMVRQVAVKVLNSSMGAFAEVAARHRDEARLLAQLNHENIVHVLDLVEVHGQPAVIMEYVEGVDAGELLEQGALPVRAALQLVAGAAGALDAAWSTVSPRTGEPLRVVHRDIKPQNLMVTRGGGVKLLDFGIARAEFDREGETRDLQFGTPKYMSPELVISWQASHGSDVFALGMCLLELLSGHTVERMPPNPEGFHEVRGRLLDALPTADWPPAWRRILVGLLEELLCFDAAGRPTAAQVRERCLFLSEDAPGRSLPRFADQSVPTLIDARKQRLDAEAVLPDVHNLHTQVLDQDSLLGLRTAVEDSGPADPSTLAPAPSLPQAQQKGGSRRTLWLAVTLAVLVLLFGSLSVLGAGGIGAWVWYQEDGAAPVPAEVPARPIVDGSTRKKQPEEKAPEEAEAVSEGADPSSSGSPSRSSKRKSAESSAPEARASGRESGGSGGGVQEASSGAEAGPASTAPATAATRPITFRTVPFGADVFVDGKRRGNTSSGSLVVALESGTHTVRLTLAGFESLDTNIYVGDQAPFRYTWRPEDAASPWTGEIGQ